MRPIGILRRPVDTERAFSATSEYRCRHYIRLLMLDLSARPAELCSSARTGASGATWASSGAYVCGIILCLLGRAIRDAVGIAVMEDGRLAGGTAGRPSSIKRGVWRGFWGLRKTTAVSAVSSNAPCPKIGFYGLQSFWGRLVLGLSALSLRWYRRKLRRDLQSLITLFFWRRRIVRSTTISASCGSTGRMNGYPDRSFDGLPQFNPQAGQAPLYGPAPANPGLRSGLPTSPTTARSIPAVRMWTSFHLKTQCTENTSPSWNEAHVDWDLNDPVGNSPATLDGFVYSAAHDARATGFHDIRWPSVPWATTTAPT